MTIQTVRKYVMIRSKIEPLDQISVQNPWILSCKKLAQQEASYPENCIAQYYTVDLEKQEITDTYYIATWSQKYKQSFTEISVDWVEEHFFALEEADLKHLNHPEENIIDPGGEIFTLLDVQGQAVGVVAMLNQGDHVELGKLGLSQQYKGKGLSHPLIHEAIFWAKSQDSKKYPYVQIYTVTKLGPAVSLFTKHGFEFVPLGNYTKFARADLAMKLALQ